MRLASWAKVYRTKFEVERNMEKEHLLVLVKSGSFYLESASGKCTVNAGEAAIFYPNEKFYRRVKEPITMYLFRFHTKKQFRHEPKIVFKNKERIQSTLNLLETLDNKLYHDDFSLRESLFNDIITQYILESEAEDVYTTDPDPLIAKAKLIFEQYLHEKTPLTDTAEKLGISYVHFIRRFKQSTGVTPGEYLTKIRLERAKIFLAQNDMMIKEIAPRCGFENEYYFSNVFKKYTGMTPTAFRKKVVTI
ncbi:MAG: helix-turn-helix transcriptional regulator [Clostridia bacterium]|nr:helix-turn-helix transcriptional regulator [Clostridia bacterium]